MGKQGGGAEGRKAMEKNPGQAMEKVTPSQGKTRSCQRCYPLSSRLTGHTAGSLLRRVSPAGQSRANSGWVWVGRSHCTGTPARCCLQTQSLP